MDEELKQLEAELKRLRPVSPSPALDQRVERELERLGRVQPARRVRWLWVAVPLAAAAAVVFMIVRSRPEAEQGLALDPKSAWSAQRAGGNVMKPVAAENVLVAAEDEGVIMLQDGTTARRARLKYVDTITWKNPRTNASLTWTVPREEVRVVPIAFQ